MQSILLIVAALALQGADDISDSERDAALFGAPAAPAEGSPPASLEAASTGAAGDDAESDATDDEDAARDAALFGGNDDARDDALFGGSDADDGTGGSDRDSAIFGSETPTTMSPGFLQAAPNFGLLDDQNDTLTLGGQLFLRANASFRDGQGFDEAAVNGASLLDAFADVRPSDRVRAYAQLRFNFDYTVDPGETNAFGQELSAFSLQLAQAWTKFDIGQVAYITAGRQRIRWGTGRFWNPTDFINQEVRNSVDFFDQRLGVDLVKVHFPLEQLGWNLYLITAFNGLDVVADTGLAARAEFLLGQAELALSSFVKKDAPLRFGADISAGVWLFDVKAEGVLSRGLARRLFEGEFDLAEGKVPEEIDTDDDWFFEGVVGIEGQFKYTDVDTVVFGAEYFYNQAGYTSATLYPFLFLNGAYVPLYTGQHYVAVYGSLPGPLWFDDLNLTVSTLGNLSDQSFLSRFDVQYTLLQYVTVNGFVSAHWGAVGEFKLGIDIPPVPAVPALANGITLANDFIDVGAALRVAF